MNTSHLTEAADILRSGGIVAYPTEAVYGLGCDPLNRTASYRLLALKQRTAAKGLILIGADWQQLRDYVTPLADEQLSAILSTWPGPITWVLPAASKTPAWISGDHPTVAVRVTAHPLAKALCEAFGGAVVSTSANIGGHPPLYTATEVKHWFGAEVYVLAGELGQQPKPTEIRDGITGAVLRKG